MYIHPAGYRVILVFFVLVVLVAVLVHFIPGIPGWLEWGVRGALIALFCLVLWLGYTFVDILEDLYKAYANTRKIYKCI